MHVSVTMYCINYCLTYSTAVCRHSSKDSRLVKLETFIDMFNFIRCQRSKQMLQSLFRKFPCVEHWRERFRLQGIMLSQSHSWIHVSGI